MRFVDDDEIGLRKLAPRERLSAANLNRLPAIRAEVSSLHHADRRDALALEFSDGLVDQGLARDYESNAIALVERAGDDMRRSQRLARASRHLEHWAPVASRHRLAQRVDGAFLVRAKRPEGGSHAPPPFASVASS